MTTGQDKGQLPKGSVPGHADTPYKRLTSIRTVGSVLTFVAIGAATCGCSLPPSLSASGIDPVTTGSIVQPVAYTERTPPAGVAPDDWVAARQALATALRDTQAAPSVPWANPARQSSGMVTPIGESRSTQDGTCRDFMVTFIHANDSENADWLQGSACRTARGSWQIDEARLLERS